MWSRKSIRACLCEFIDARSSTSIVLKKCRRGLEVSTGRGCAALAGRESHVARDTGRSRQLSRDMTFSRVIKSESVVFRRYLRRKFEEHGEAESGCDLVL